MSPQSAIALLLVFLSSVFHSTAVAQWRCTNGPYGGPVYSLAVSESVFYAGTGNGVYRVNAAGDGWVRTPAQPAHLNITAIAEGVRTAVGRELYVGTYAGGVFRTTNGGESWRAVNNGLTNLSVKSLSICRYTNGREIIAANTRGGVFISRDGAATWTTVMAGREYMPFLTCIANDSSGMDIYFESTGGKLTFSTDSGEHWFFGQRTLPSTSINGIAAVCDTSGIPVLFVNWYGVGIYCSSDTGRTWSLANIAPDEAPFEAMGAYSDAHGRTVLWVAGRNGILHRSMTCGRTWKHNSTPEMVGFAVAVAEGRNRNGVDELIASFKYGDTFFSSDDGLTWRKTIDGLVNTDVTKMAVMKKPSGEVLLFANDLNGRLWRTSDHGDHWTQIAAVNAANTSMRPVAAGSILCVQLPENGILLSSDYGDTWKTKKLKQRYFYSIAAEGKRIVLGGRDSIAISIDYGETWAEYPAPFPGYGNYHVVINAGIVYDVVACRFVFRSCDDGRTWLRIIDASNSESIDKLFFNGLYMYAIHLNSASFSADYGTHWRQMDIGPMMGTITSLAFVGSNVFAGTWSGNGIGWTTGNTAPMQNISRGIEGLDVMDCIVQPNDGRTRYLFAATTGGGVWRRDVAEIVPASDLPVQTAVFTNYPNPFNASTTIKLDFDRPFIASIHIYNTLGQLVGTFPHSAYAAGTHRIPWTPRNLPSGVYFYRLQAWPVEGGGELTQVKKMMLVR